MRTDNADFLRPVMAVIRKADPALFAAMSASDTMVGVISDGGEPSVVELTKRSGVGNAINLFCSLPDAYGVTLVDPVTRESGFIFLNRSAIERDAREIDIADFTASIMVHEFVHNQGTIEEGPCYAAQMAFAEKQGIYALWEMARRGRARAPGINQDVLS